MDFVYCFAPLKKESKMTKKITKTMTLSGRELSIETGRMAKQANGSVLVKYGKT